MTCFLNRSPALILALIFLSGCATTTERHPSKRHETKAKHETRAQKETLERVLPEILTIHTVVIDPGHGGKDPGAIGDNGIKEKDLVLDIAKRLKGELERTGQLKVIMTHESDAFISLGERSRIANQAKADLFISIHSNSSKYKTAKGLEVYYLSSATDDNARAIEAAENESLSFETGPAGMASDEVEATIWDMTLAENREESRELASYICDASKGGLCTRTRGVKTANFYVLKGTHIPSILVEVGFVSNQNEAESLNDPKYRQSIASTIADGVLLYKQKFEKTEGFTKGVR